MKIKLTSFFLAFWLTNACVFADSYQEILDKAVKETKPGVVALLSRGGDIEFVGARGMANLELGVPLTKDSVFRIGSITKQFTAAAIMMLVEKELLSLEDDIHQYIPDFPTEGHVITVYHLLTHTSGLANYTDDYELMTSDIKAPATVDKVIKRFYEHPMTMAPGEAFAYSNTGYVLLGKIIEVVSGKSYPEFIDEEIFKKLGMQNSYYGGNKIIPNRASGYGLSARGFFENAEYLDMIWPYSAGALLSTVEDLNTWFFALRNGDLVSKESYQLMVTLGQLSNGETVDYGLGFDLSDQFGFKLSDQFGVSTVSHSGGIHGFTADSYYIVEDDVYVVALTNRLGSLHRKVAREIVKLAIDD